MAGLCNALFPGSTRACRTDVNAFIAGAFLSRAAVIVSGAVVFFLLSFRDILARETLCIIRQSPELDRPGKRECAGVVQNGRVDFKSGG